MTSISGLPPSGYSAYTSVNHSKEGSTKTDTSTVANVAQEPASGAASSKSFQSVASDARAALDRRYQELDLPSSGEYLHRTGSFRDDMFDAMDFDRRSLFAIASNEGGQFSNEEIKAAKSIMHEQLGDAMRAVGGLTGPNPNHAGGHKAAIDFLETAASPEEKASFEWAKERAAAQMSYQMETRGTGENVASDSPVVNLLLTAYSELFAAYNDDMRERLENMPSYKGAMQEWARINNKDHVFSIKV